MRPTVFALLFWMVACGPTSSCSKPGAVSLRVELGQAAHAISPLLFGEGMEWQDYGQGLLQPDFVTPAPGTLRPELVQALAATRMTVLRYPGGTLSDLFHWSQAVGPMGGRQDQRNQDQSSPGVLKTETPWFGPDEFQGLATVLGTQPLLTVNVMTGTAQEAADWVAHTVAHGFSAARYWEVGNEPYFPLVAPSVAPALTPEDYAQRFDQFALAMRAQNPNIQLLATGWRNYPGMCLSYCQNDWNARLYAHLTQPADLIAVHDAYAPAAADGKESTLRAMLAAPQDLQKDIAAQISDLQTYGGPGTRDAGLAVTEHAAFFVSTASNVPDLLRDLQRTQTLVSALYSALVFNVLLSEPRVVMANHINPLSFAFQAAVNTAVPDYSNLPVSYPTNWVPEPTVSAYGEVLSLYRDAASARFVPVTVSDGPTFDAEASGVVAAHPAVPVIDAMAAVQQSQAYVYVVNRSLEQPVKGSVAIADAAVVSAIAETLSASSCTARNAPGEAPQVTLSLPAPVSVQAGSGQAVSTASLEWAFPACSLTRFTLQLE